MALAKVNIEKKEEAYSIQRKWIAFLFVALFHFAAWFSMSHLGFYKSYPPPQMQGIEIAIEVEPRPQGIARRDPRQKPVTNPSIVNTPGNTAPESAPVSTRNESTKPAPQPESKPSELNDEGDVPVKTPEPKINQKGLFQSTSEGVEEANNPTPIDENSLYPGAGQAETPSRTSDTPIGTDPRQPVTYDLSGRSPIGGFPLPDYNSRNRGKVVVQITVNQEGRVTKATAIGRGSTVQDAKLWKAAEKAAMEARFNINKDASIYQVGTITYEFSQF
jgi:TonB family protein